MFSFAAGSEKVNRLMVNCSNDRRSETHQGEAKLDVKVIDQTKIVTFGCYVPGALAVGLAGGRGLLALLVRFRVAAA